LANKDPANNQKKRTYFDSGDFALCAAHQASDNGAIQTGRSHPHRESISHPYAPVPSTSNAGNNANEDFYRRESMSPERKSLLSQGTDIEPKSPTKEKKQGDFDFCTR